MKVGKSMLGVAAVFTVASVLTGCGVSSLKFEGETKSRPQIEEVLEDRLEAENPGMDLEVTIADDTDSSKKKRKSGGKK